MVASLYGRNNLHDIVKTTSDNIFVPITLIDYGIGLAVLDDETNRLADTIYGGHTVTAAFQTGNIIGTQFHPKKSA